MIEKTLDLSPLDREGLCLLSLDGGGVRGLSTLYILKRIMDAHNDKRRKMGDEPQKPSDVFDLIGGTSTGGLIAIMLGRLKMDVDECIASYNNLIRVVFDERSRIRQLKVNYRGRTQARFDSNKLRDAIERTLRDRGLSSADKMTESTESACKLFVCATSKNSATTYRFRNYYVQKTCIDATISQAAQATAAATTFFDPVSIEDMDFVDGAFGANNPVEQVEEEAAEIWCPETGNIKPLVKCFISIGTGNMGTYEINDRVDRFMGTLAKMATDTERIAEASTKRWRQHYDQGRYFRFNVEQGLQSVGMKEYNKKGAIQGATYRYLDSQVQTRHLRRCVDNLALKHKHTGPQFERLILGYQWPPSTDSPNAPDSSNGFEDQPPTYPSPTMSPSLESCVSVPMKLTSGFLGRDDHITKLYAAFSQDCHSRAALVGLPGAGKTQIGLFFVDCVRLYYPDYSVFWVSTGDLQDSYTRIARDLNLFKVYEHEYTQPQAEVLLRRYLGLNEIARWIMIIDDVEDTADIPDIPKSARGRVLFITRSMKVATAAVSHEADRVIGVDGLDGHIALSLFENLLLNKKLLQDKPRAEELLCELSNLPLVIYHIARYLNDHPQINIEKLLTSLKCGIEDALGLITKEYNGTCTELAIPISIYSTFANSFESLRNRSQDATAILELITKFEPKYIPRSLLRNTKANDKGNSLEDAIGILCSLFFLEPDPGGESYNIPTIVYLSARAWVRQNNGSRRLTIVATKRLNRLTPDEDSSSRLLWKKYQPHALRVLRSCQAFNLELEERFQLTAKVGFWLIQQRDLEKSIVWLEQSYNWVKKSQPKSSRRLRIQISLAEVYAETGQPTKAIKLAEKAMSMQEKHFPKDDSLLVAASCTLARGHRYHGQSERVIARLEALRKANDKRDPRDRFILMAELGKCYGYKSDYKKAIEVLKVAVSSAKGKTPKDDTAFLIVKNHLAHAYAQDGLMKDAIAILEESLPVQQKILGRAHKDTLDIQTRLAEAYCKVGDTRKAVNQWQELVNIQRVILGQTHETTMASENNLATAYYDNKEANKALALLKAMVSTRQRCLAQTNEQRRWAEETWKKYMQDWEWTWRRR